MKDYDLAADLFGEPDFELLSGRAQAGFLTGWNRFIFSSYDCQAKVGLQQLEHSVFTDFWLLLGSAAFKTHDQNR